MLAAPASKVVDAEIIPRDDCVLPNHIEVVIGKTYMEAELDALYAANTVCGGQPSMGSPLDDFVATRAAALAARSGDESLVCL